MPTTHQIDPEAISYDESQKNFDNNKFIDPYVDEIPPALLNGYDIEKYIEKCGIIFPYQKDLISSATYKIPFYGDVYHWEDSKSKMIATSIPRNGSKEPYILQPNSISYIHIDTFFRVPFYMVFRFNLTVSLAHRGLLLGTGPIVDPGFNGRILIPVHNLTANNYKLYPGDGLIRVEFTKLSYHSIFYGNETYKNYKFPLLENIKTDIETYFKDINNHNPIVSSIPEAMADAKISAENASQRLGSIKKILSVTASLGIIGTAAGVIYPTWSLVNDTNTLVASLTDKTSEIQVLKDKVEKQEKSIEKLETIIKTKTIVKKEIIKDSTGQCLIIKGQCDEKNRDMRGDCIRQNDPCLTPTTK